MLYAYPYKYIITATCLQCWIPSFSWFEYEIAQWLRALAVPPEDPGSISEHPHGGSRAPVTSVTEEIYRPLLASLGTTYLWGTGKNKNP